MANIRAPDQVLIRGRENYNDLERQSNIRSPRLPGLRNDSQFFSERKLPWPMSSVTLLYYNPQRPQHPIPMEDNARVRSPEIRKRRETSTTKKTDTKPTAAYQYPDSSEERHDERKKKLLQVLESGLSANHSETSHVFLCYKKGDHCRIFPVEIPSSADDFDMWQGIHQGWYAHRGHWRKYIPFFVVKGVDLVEISIVGLEPKSKQRFKYSRCFRGTCTTEGLNAEQKRLEITTANFKTELSCSYQPSTGYTDCCEDCESLWNEYSECPVREISSVRRQLSCINKRRQHLKIVFSDPSIGMVNNLLNRTALINSHRDILSKLDVWHCPDLGELEFLGLQISEGWEADIQHVVFPLTITAFFLLVVGAKLVYGDWGTAWNVGCFVVSLATLLWMWANHCVS